VRVRRTRTSNETARVIVHVLCSFWEKEYSEHRSLQTLRQPSTLTLAREDEATARMRRMCVSLKTGIGYGRSKAVAEHFRSIHNMALADLHAWEGIAGIGKGIARGTLDAIHEEVGTRRLPQVKSTKASAGRVSARARVSTGRIRHSRRRQSTRLDAASSAET
jgi:ERCC4-type nuclease